MAVQDPQVLVLTEDPSTKGKGGLFERFIAKLLADPYGFEDPKSSNLNVTAEGVELDIVASHRLTGARAVAECKAYTRAVKSSELTNFYGKLTIERFEDPQSFGLFCALPRLTPEGQEKAREITSRDKAFKYLSAADLVVALLQAGLICELPPSISDASDPAVLITELGIYAAAVILDSVQRTPVQVGVWAASGSVPDKVQHLLASSEFATGLPVRDIGSVHPAQQEAPEPIPVMLTHVVGSKSDFEYQLPASPRFFVGRGPTVHRLEESLDTERGTVMVLNAQSGWGKSSLALKMSDLVTKRGGISLILDTRTADHPRYVIEVLRSLGQAAEEAGILSLPPTASWASLESSLTTLRLADWRQSNRPLLAFFDQFENVFRDVDMTRAFRDLALGSRSISAPLVIGFAWKTDLVGWTEGHPYQLRDDIRSSGTVITVEPFGPREVDTILGRMAKQADVRLLPDLRSRLRAYSQGLPWLLKKLADHVLRELKRGETQEGLLAESLNIVALFEADLAELNPSEHTVLRHVARFAPIPAGEVTERFGPVAVQSLVDRRLLVQVGDRLDTYWDTFRDFLNTGSVPVQESWILRQTPRGVSRLLSAVVERGGDVSVRELVEILDTSDRAIFNMSRELRLLGVTAHESNRVRLIEEVLEADDREQEMRRRVGDALRRHRAHSAFRSLAERSGGPVSLDSYSRELPNVFPAVAVARTAWTSYARAFLFWMVYAGLVTREGNEYKPVADAAPAVSFRLLDPPTPLKYRAGVPQIAPRRAIDLLMRIHNEGEIDLPSGAKDREATGTLLALGAVFVSQARRVRIAVDDLINTEGNVSPERLHDLLEEVPGGAAGLAVIKSDPAARPYDVGLRIAEEVRGNWTDLTTRSIGGHFRSWAKMAGLPVVFPRRKRAEA